MELSAPKKYNWLMWRGNTRTLRIDVPFDLTGYNATLFYGAEGNLISRTMTIASLDSTYWTVSTKFTPLETRALIRGKSYEYELQLRAPSGDEYTYLTGQLVADGGVNGD